MSNPNSHSSNPSTSSLGIIRTSTDDRLATGLFASAYPFAFTEDYQSSFGGDSAAQLPASYRLEYWHKNVSAPAWEREQAEAAEQNRKYLEAHSHYVADTKDKNQQRAARNEARQTAYLAKMEAYRESRRRYEAELSAAHERAKEVIASKCKTLLDDAIRDQRDAIDRAFENAVELAAKSADLDGWKTIFWILAIVALVTSPTVFGPSICGGIAFMCVSVERTNARKRLVETVNSYSRLGRDTQREEKRYIFFTTAKWKSDSDPLRIYSPAQRFDPGSADPERWYEERDPLGKHDPEASDSDSWEGFGFLLSFLPVIGFFLAYEVRPSRRDLQRLANRLNSDDFRRERREKLHTLLGYTLDDRKYMSTLIDKYLDENGLLPKKPREPERPQVEPMLSLPTSPNLRTPQALEPPVECFDEQAAEDGETVFKGAQVHAVNHVKTLAIARLFADDRVRPYFVFGGVPFEIAGGSPHMLVVGASGSGKTTAILKLMSSLLPLSRSQAEKIEERARSGESAYPRSTHEWGRSLTHQAVVYNAKGEYLKYLRAFGFDADRDLYNLDPADPNCYAWDVASDINDPDSVKKFAEQLVPMNTAAARDRQLEFWLGTARSVVEAIIVSFRNAARREGKKPSWTLRDLVTAVSTDETVKHILRWHDTPQQKLQSIFGLSDAQTSSIMMTLRECMENFTIVGNRWYDAQTRGRSISLKQWAKEGSRSVLVLPNTKENQPSYGPLNQSIVKALTSVFLNHDYSFYVDANGKERSLRRFMFIDEFGQAGQLGELERLMSEGRSFGLNIVLGLHQLSQVREAYGENGSETIIGLCSYIACLKNNDSRTQKWMSDTIGKCLRSYEKKSFSYSTSQGKTVTTSSNTTIGESRGTSESQSRGTSEGTSSTHGESSTQSAALARGSTTQSGHSPSHNSSSTDTKGTSTSSSETSNQSTNESSTTSTQEQSSTSTSTGSSEADNTTTNEGQSKTRELRGEAAIEPDEFGKFPDPETTGLCEGVYITPTLPIWRSTLTLDPMRPEYEFPERVRERSAKRSQEEDELVSRSVEWAAPDLQRLFLDKPHLLPAVPHVLVPRQMPIQQQMEYQIVEEPPEDDPPLADFNF